MRKATVLVALALALAACGQSGDLYLPPKPAPEAVPPAAPAPTATDDPTAEKKKD